MKHKMYRIMVIKLVHVDRCITEHCSKQQTGGQERRMNYMSNKIVSNKIQLAVYHQLMAGRGLLHSDD